MASNCAMTISPCGDGDTRGASRTPPPYNAAKNFFFSRAQIVMKYAPTVP